MEIVSGTSIKKIFLDNENWYNFYSSHKGNFRPAIIDNVLKMLSCGTRLMGYTKYICPDHRDHYLVVKHSCKSRFCSSCGKKATDMWIANNSEKLPDTVWQHITFTLPDKYWPIFWLNRNLMKLVPAIAANIIKELAHKKEVDIGIFLAVHTFGRDLKKNYHIHLSTTLCGMSYDKKVIKNLYFHHSVIKKKWKYSVTELLRSHYKTGDLKLPKSWNIKELRDLNFVLNKNYLKKWVVHLNKSSNEHKRNIEYFGKYLKRPPIGETRIKSYDGRNVVFYYLDHSVKMIKLIKMSVIEFIKRLICHIPDKYFRSIRYYGILSSRRIGSDLTIFKSLLADNNIEGEKKEKITFRSMFMKAFGKDPMECSICKREMVQCWKYYTNKTFLRSIHARLAQGLL